MSQNLFVLYYHYFNFTPLSLCVICIENFSNTTFIEQVDEYFSVSLFLNTFLVFGPNLFFKGGKSGANKIDPSASSVQNVITPTSCIQVQSL
jgi:hypothetical protein